MSEQSLPLMGKYTTALTQNFCLVWFRAKCWRGHVCHENLPLWPWLISRHELWLQVPMLWQNLIFIKFNIVKKKKYHSFNWNSCTINIHCLICFFLEIIFQQILPFLLKFCEIFWWKHFCIQFVDRLVTWKLLLSFKFYWKINL